MTILPVNHHGGHNIGPIVFILGMNLAKYKDMPYGKRLAFFGSFLTKNDTFAS